MGQQGTYPIGARILAGNDTLTGVVTGATADVPVSGVLGLVSAVYFPAVAVPSANPNTLDDYAEGSWVPSQGADLTVVGTFTSWGQYTKIGRMVVVQGHLAGATSIALAGGGFGRMCGNLPFTSRAETLGASYGGTAVIGFPPVTGVSVAVLQSSKLVIAYSAIAATPYLDFSLTYFI